MNRPPARAIAVALVLLAMPAALPAAAQSQYTNPIIFADYSDPDVIRVGDDYYLVASSFHAVPGLPILHSRDLVSWEIIAYAAPRLPSPRYDTPRHGEGIWAPSIRHHDGAYWIYVGDPDLGVFMTKARDPRGPWEPLTLVKEARGWIDPCPLWDDDGSMYLVHAWAKSRVGFNSVLSVNRLSPDGRRVVDEGAEVFDGYAKHPTIEGPKLYKRNGYYYIFAPAGGVKPGWQTVLRSRNVLGPYEDRIVLAQGTTPINGPHQGAWVETPAGESWFVHFQDRGAYGRIVHLQPMRWKDDWPVMGTDPDGDGTGEPVLTFAMPDGGKTARVFTLPMSDEFDGPAIGLQWQWQANPQPAWWSLAVRPGALRLAAVAAPPGAANLWPAPNLLLQKFPAESFDATARVNASALGAGEKAGLAVMGLDYAILTVSRAAAGWTVHTAVCARADTGAAERVTSESATTSATVYLRASVRPRGAVTQFSWSTDGTSFHVIGQPFTVREGRWVGAKVGVFAIGSATAAVRGSADIDWFRVDIGPEGRRSASAGDARGPIPWSRCLDQPDAWYGSADAVAVADTVLLYQRATGGWPKNIDMARPLAPEERAAVVAARPLPDSTIDNGATITQLRFLARVQAATRQQRFTEAFLAGLDCLIAAQYPNGGWPQFFPLRADYSRRITFNDDAMVNVLELMEDVSKGRGGMAFVDAARRARATAALEKGTQVILASQIRVNGTLTAWCAQVDEVTLAPRIARTYEHPSISGKESIGIVRFLMSRQKPAAAAVVAAVEGAVAWFRKVRIEGLRVVDRPDPALPGGVDRIVVSDPAAPPIWARFYEIGTNRPIYSGRDSIIRYTLAEIELERRVNYSWLGPYAADLLARDYPAWKAALGSTGK